MTVSDACNSTAAIHTGDNGRQLPLWPRAVPTTPNQPWAARPGIGWLELARLLPANLSVELTAEHGWRIVPLPAETRRALELLEVYEGDVIPDAAMREQRRRTVEAQLLLDQSLAVLRSVQADNDAARLRRDEAAS